MATKQQNELWNSMSSEIQKRMRVLYFTEKSQGLKVGAFETLYGKDNLENE